MPRKQFKIVSFVQVDPNEENETLYRTRAEAEADLGELELQQPENSYQIEEVSVDLPRDEYLRRFPRICAHIICESLGYATPSTAAQILKDAAEGRENWCEWIYSCYGRDPTRAIRNAIRSRHHHKGYMAEFSNAKALVDRANKTGEEPIFGSWF